MKAEEAYKAELKQSDIDHHTLQRVQWWITLLLIY